MPKTIGTRRQKAQELVKMLEAGPASLDRAPITASDYKLWVETWILPAVKSLVPELKPRRDKSK